MSDKKEPIRLITNYMIRYFINGGAWLCFAVLNLFDDNNKVLGVISAIFLFIAAGCSFASLVIKSEPEDEMGQKHIYGAKAITLDYLLAVIMIIGIISILGVNISFNKVYPFIIAVSHVVVGVEFWIREKAGI